MIRGYVYVVAAASADPRRRQKRAVVEAACGAVGLDAYYPDYDPAAPRFDAARECEIIRAAVFSLVDLSFERPSAYFELGMIEALGRPVALFAENGTLIHQTSLRAEVKFYANDEALDAAVREALLRVAS